VIAAKLILIKSQALLPRPPSIEVEDDVGDDLVHQLLAYKQFKEVAKGLGQREAEGLRSFIRLAPPPKIEVTHLDLTGITVEGSADSSPACAGCGGTLAARRRCRQAAHHHHPQSDCTD